MSLPREAKSTHVGLGIVQIVPQGSWQGIGAVLSCPQSAEPLPHGRHTEHLFTGVYRSLSFCPSSAQTPAQKGHWLRAPSTAHPGAPVWGRAGYVLPAVIVLLSPQCLCTPQWLLTLQQTKKALQCPQTLGGMGPGTLPCSPPSTHTWPRLGPTAHQCPTGRLAFHNTGVGSPQASCTVREFHGEIPQLALQLQAGKKKMLQMRFVSQVTVTVERESKIGG